MSSKSSQSSTAPCLDRKSADWTLSPETSLSLLIHRSGVLAVKCLDRLLRHRLRISEFSDQPECLFRVSMTRSDAFVKLGDGTEIGEGDPLLELHLWNEHLALIGNPVATLAWGLHLLKRVRFSLMLLADCVEHEEEWEDVRAIHARFVTCMQRPEQAIRRLGFSIASPRRSVGGRVHDYFENFLVRALIWAFHPCNNGRSRRELKRLDLWLSKASLQEAYGRSGLSLREPTCSEDSLEEPSNSSRGAVV